MAQIQAGDRLHSWKQIAAYFGRDQRTVKRWERERGLPVRRLPGGGRSNVYANIEDIEAWLSAESDGPVHAPLMVPAPRTQGLFFLPAVMLLVALIGLTAVFMRPVETEAFEPDPRAKELYLSGTYLWGTRTSDGILAAIADLEAALAIEPDYAQAHASLAVAYNLVSQYGLSQIDEPYARAEQEAKIAISLDPRQALGHAALGFARFYGARDLEAARRDFEQAIALDPGDADVLHWYGLVLMHTGAFDRSLELVGRARDHNPQSRSVLANLGLIKFHAGDTAKALDLLEALSTREPDFLPAQEYLATIYLDLGRHAEFVARYIEAAHLTGNEARLRIGRAAQRGLRESPQRMLDLMYEAQLEEAAQDREPQFKLAITAAYRGETDVALTHLQRAVANEEPQLAGLRLEPALLRLRDEPAYRALVDQAGLGTF